MKLDSDLELKVSLLLVVKNERHFVDKALNSLINQDYPIKLTEIILIDGLSTDGTCQYLLKKAKELNECGRQVRFYHNPKGSLASGWNIGIKHATGDIVCRIDAHSEIAPDYIRKGIRNLVLYSQWRYGCVGGIINENVGNSKIGEVIADLFSSRFGVGNSPFRISDNKPKESDTAVFGLYWKSIFDEVGYFNEGLFRNQDIEFHERMKQHGYRFLTHPEMKIKYYVRTSIKKLIKKALGDGYWVVVSKRFHLRHMIPLFFVSYLLLLPFCLYEKIYAAAMPLFLYCLLATFFALNGGKKNKAILFFLFFVFHLSYGLGSIKGIISLLYSTGLYSQSAKSYELN